MKYKDIKVCGHRRSGTHYIASLISVNFFNDEKYGKIYEKHKTPEKLKIKNNPDVLFIYVGRDFDWMSKSLFKMRKRFGLSENNYNKFLNTRYCDMFSRDQKNVNVRVDTLINTKYVHKVGSGLSRVKMTPYEFGKFDKDRGVSLSETTNNVLIVKYNNFLTNFNGEMKRISDKAGCDKTKFENINKRVGGTPIG